MTTISLSDRINRVEPSATVAISARANELRAEGKDIINLSVGEPDFDTPEYVKKAAIEAINEGFTKYTAVDGILPLKKAIIKKFERDNQLSYTPNQIIVSNGAKQGLYNLCQALLNAGDEVLIPAPYWVSYPAMVKLADATPVVISAPQQQDFKITAEQLNAAITPKTKFLFLNTPSNPSGKAYTHKELKALGDVLVKHPHVLIATDDIYEYIMWKDDAFSSILNACPELADRTIIFNGVSKAYAMTGWRIGYAAGPEKVIKAMKKIQSQSTTNPNSIAQVAAAVALEAGRDKLMYMINSFKNRHDQVLEALNAMEGIDCRPADGTFYLFPNAQKAIDKLGLASDVELAAHLLDHAQVATVPGTAFGMPGHIRLSCATSNEALTEAMKRLSQVFV
jgi:aspartate aminotransferase